MSSSGNKGHHSKILASSDEQPPFVSLVEKNSDGRQRKIYAQYHAPDGLGGVPIPGTLHWAIQVVSADEIADNEPGYIWELAQTELKIRINASTWPGAKPNSKDFLGYTFLTDEEICDHGLLDCCHVVPSNRTLADSATANGILSAMNTDSFGVLDVATRLYLRPLGLAHSLQNKSPGEAQAYDALVQNCQEFARGLKDAICTKAPQPVTSRNTVPTKEKRRFLRKTGKFLKVVFIGRTSGFRKFGTGLLKRALISSLSNPQFIQPGPGR
ncbi:MAG: hypothetical protein Q9166_006845 [cf. Caloplaca sp. 2 TL-2023]